MQRTAASVAAMRAAGRSRGLTLPPAPDTPTLHTAAPTPRPNRQHHHDAHASLSWSPVGGGTYFYLTKVDVLNLIVCYPNRYLIKKKSDEERQWSIWVTELP